MYIVKKKKKNLIAAKNLWDKKKLNLKFLFQRLSRSNFFEFAFFAI